MEFHFLEFVSQAINADQPEIILTANAVLKSVTAHFHPKRGGLDGWRKRRGDLYQKNAGQNITVLQPDKEQYP
jgi:hypothetical protein